jgi:hypothetical protein
MSRRRWPVILVAAALAGGCGPTAQTPSAVPSASAVARASAAPASPSTWPAPTPSPSSAASAAPSFALGSGPIDPANFITTVDNPWFPLIPGTVFTAVGDTEDGHVVDTFSITRETKVVDGVLCVVIDDRVTVDGVLEERTSDYYTQDLAGNVWYFGEDTAELDAKGKVTNTEGTWHGGVDGAVPGIFMEANPVVGHTYRQEFYKGHAEDQYRVKDLNASVTVPYGAFTDVLVTEEWTALEPDVLGQKFYAKGVGQILELTVKGPPERLELTAVAQP